MDDLEAPGAMVAAATAVATATRDVVLLFTAGDPTSLDLCANALLQMRKIGLEEHALVVAERHDHCEQLAGRKVRAACGWHMRTRGRFMRHTSALSAAWSCAWLAQKPRGSSIAMRSQREAMCRLAGVLRTRRLVLRQASLVSTPAPTLNAARVRLSINEPVHRLPAALPAPSPLSG